MKALKEQQQVGAQEPKEKEKEPEQKPKTETEEKSADAKESKEQNEVRHSSLNFSYMLKKKNLTLNEAIGGDLTNYPKATAENTVNSEEFKFVQFITFSGILLILSLY